MFENLIGNNNIKELLNNIVVPSHSYIFVGKDGIGKYLFAKEFAHKWLCNAEEKPCGICKACIQFNNNNNMDFEIIEPDKESIKVEQIRDVIKKIYQKPIESSKKIFIINNADKMTPSAQNALLKVLEEPPVYVIIILIGENEHFFLNTIKSRCIIVKFKEIETEELEKYLNEHGKIVPKELIDIYQGSIGKIKKISGYEEQYIELKNIILNLKNLSRIEIIKKLSKVFVKENINDLLEYMNVLVFKMGVEDIKYLSIVQEINVTISRLKNNCNFEMVIDNLIFNICKIMEK